MRRPALAVLLVLAAFTGSAQAQVALEPVGSFAEPTYLTAPPGDTARLFVVERAGYVRVVRPGSPAALFLDVHTVVGVAGEGGLLSLAFSPDYAVSGRFYVYYTDSASTIRVREYRVSADPNLADAGSGREVLNVPHPGQTNHVGGQLAFGPDGYLYIGTGDGGSGGDPPNNAQNPGVLLGKLLRIDPRGTAPGEHAVPPGNALGTAPQVWALGLRNPWRFSFDRATGALLIGDVGQNAWEEVDYLPAGTAGGVNFGWRRFEGLHVFSAGTAIFGGQAVAPILEYEHVGGACSITGGFVVRDASVPSLAGRYVYADYCAGRLRSLIPDLPAARDDSALGITVGQPISFGQDGLCRVYVLAQGGAVQRLVERPTTLAPGCPATAPTPPAPPPVPPAPPGSPPGGGGSAGPALTTRLSAVAQQRLGLVLRTGLRARCTVSEAARCTVAAVMSAKTARALGLARRGRATAVTFARGSVVLPAAGEQPVALRLSATARRVLAARSAPFRASVRLLAQALTVDGRSAAAVAKVVLARR